MKISTLLFVLGLLPMSLFAQRMESYTASNGRTYRTGDVISLSTIMYSEYKHVRFSGWQQMNGAENPSASYGSKQYVIEKITNTPFGTFGQDRVMEMHLRTGGIKLIVDIEAALIACEIECAQTLKMEVIGGQQQAPPDKYDQLKKLKELLDSGSITQDEYDTEKKKILEKD